MTKAQEGGSNARPVATARGFPQGVEKLLHSFGSSSRDGVNPYAGLTYVNGSLYGTTSAGGTYGLGTVFSITPQGEKVRHAFGSSSNQDAQEKTPELDPFSSAALPLPDMSVRSSAPSLGWACLPLDEGSRGLKRPFPLAEAMVSGRITHTARRPSGRPARHCVPAGSRRAKKWRTRGSRRLKYHWIGVAHFIEEAAQDLSPATDSSRPMPAPIDVTISPSRRIMRNVSPASAPRAVRMPISRVRRVTA